MRTTAALDALLVIIVFALTLWVATASGLPAAGTWAVVAGLAVGAWRLRRAGLGLAEAGLGATLLPAWRVALAALGLAVLALLAVALLVTPLGNALDWPAQDLSRFAGIRGDAPGFIGYLLLAWTSAAIGEELLFRGILLHRLTTALGPRLHLLAVPLQACLFGLGHAYLGARGIAAATLIGVVFGGAWLRNGGRVLPLILAHGLVDTVSLTAIAAGAAA